LRCQCLQAFFEEMQALIIRRLLVHRCAGLRSKFIDTLLEEALPLIQGGAQLADSGVDLADVIRDGRLSSTPALSIDQFLDLREQSIRMLAEVTNADAAAYIPAHRI
jgi:hypothetical protein